MRSQVRILSPRLSNLSTSFAKSPANSCGLVRPCPLRPSGRGRSPYCFISRLPLISCGFWQSGMLTRGIDLDDRDFRHGAGVHAELLVACGKAPVFLQPAESFLDGIAPTVGSPRWFVTWQPMLVLLERGDRASASNSLRSAPLPSPSSATRDVGDHHATKRN